MTDDKHAKTAIVFGGSRGIGAAIAARFAKDGFAVGLTYASRADKAEALVQTIDAVGGKAMAIKADSSNPEEIRMAVDATVDAFGSLQAAVINAGIMVRGTIESVRVEDLDQILSVNVRGVFLAMQAAAARMSDGGRIITIGSNTAVRSSFPGSSLYAMSKAAVATMVKGVAIDLAPRRITVNNVQPGPTETDMTGPAVGRLAEMSPLRRVGQPDEIAALAAYLASAEAGYMTGSSLTIDGGFAL